MSLLKRRIVSRGFTIVELLIVIVIIGILSTLVFVSYTGISDLARKAALSSNAQSVLRSLKVYLVDNENFDPLTLDETNVTSTLNMDSTGYETLAMYSQSGENYIYIVGKASFSGLIACGIQGSINVYKADEAACAFGGSGNVVAVVVDATPGVLGGGNGSTCALAKTIDSIEDLVVLATSTNAGTTYSGICIILTTDLDFTQNKSYKSPAATTYQDGGNNTQSFGDINDNSIIEGIKTELTTAAGFRPIGTSANYFRGVLKGQQNYIYNLYINRPTTDYVGLFGYSSGAITSLNLTDINITGQNNVGGITGYSWGDSDERISDATITGSIVGNTYVGLVAGRLVNFVSAVHIRSVVVEGSVSGADYVGGIVGESSGNTVIGVNNGGSITCPGTRKGRLAGYTSATTTISGYAISSVTINGSTVNQVESNTSNGASISALSDITSDINSAEQGLDTYIGGDNDSDGYYWDYDGNNNLIKKSTATDPLAFSLSGSGTAGTPYLVGSYADLKQATLQLNKVYRLTANIDLSGQKFYMLGSYSNTFSGTFDGNFYTISNIDVNSPKSSFVGVFGKSSGTIKNINLSGISIIGGNYTGGLTGHSSGTLIDNNINGNVTGASYVSLVAGYTSAGQSTSNIVQGNLVGVSFVGGLTGYSYNTPVRGIYNGGSIVATGTDYNRIAGYSRVAGYTSGLAMTSITINGSTVSSWDNVGDRGLNITSTSDYTTNINTAELALDTYIGGDTDGNGYYWDYDGSNNVIRKDTATYPLTFSLSGAGTTISPYLIASSTDLKQATLQLNKVYKLTADIDMTGLKHYELGSYTNQFTGTFYGNVRTISNITIPSSAGAYIGFSGNNGGLITGLILSGLSITNIGNYTAGIAANNSGNIRDVIVSGNVTGKDYTGLVAGYAGNWIHSALVSGNVSGAYRVGGIVGYTYNTDDWGVNQGGSIVGTSAVARIVGDARIASWSEGNAISSITVNGSTVSSASRDSGHGADITAPDLAISTTYTNCGFNFTDEVQDYIWYINGSSATFREGNL